MPSEELHSNSIDIAIAIAEVDRVPDFDGPKEETINRQLCWVTIQCAQHYIRVSIHSTAGTTSYSIPRSFPDKEVYIEVGNAESMVANYELQLDGM